MKGLLLAIAALSLLATTVIPANAQGRCFPYCRPVPNGSGGFVTVCTCQ